MKPVCNTPRRPRRRSAKDGDCPGLSGTKRPLESPSPGQSRPSRGKPRPGRNLPALRPPRAAEGPRQGREISASPRTRAAIYPEVAGGGRRARTGSSDSVAAAAHHAPHLAPACPEPRRGGSRKLRAHSGEAESIPALAPEATGPEFVDAVFAQVNPVAVSCDLLESVDERIREKHLDRLLELKYGKPTAAAPLELPPVIVSDLPRPDRSDKEP